jgi:type IV secretory pathway TraG/TraD family ATPase VirD4
LGKKKFNSVQNLSLLAPKGGSSKSTAEQRQKKHLLEPAQFLKLVTGKAVFISPAFTEGKEAYVP